MINLFKNGLLQLDDEHTNAERVYYKLDTSRVGGKATHYFEQDADETLISCRLGAFEDGEFVSYFEWLQSADA